MKNPLRYQLSEYDCGPTSMLNALAFLFERGGWTAVIFGKLVAQRIFHRGTFFRVAYSYRITI